jgi:hypothetical protein
VTTPRSTNGINVGRVWSHSILRSWPVNFTRRSVGVGCFLASIRLRCNAHHAIRASGFHQTQRALGSVICILGLSVQQAPQRRVKERTCLDQSLPEFLRICELMIRTKERTPHMKKDTRKAACKTPYEMSRFPFGRRLFSFVVTAGSGEAHIAALVGNFLR